MAATFPSALAFEHPKSTTTLLISLLALLVSSAVASWVFQRWWRLHHIPGPLGNGLSKLWLLRVSLGGRFYLELKSLTDKYGDLVRVGPNELVSSDVDFLRRITAPKSPYRRSMWYKTFQLIPGEDHVFSIMDEGRHMQLKRKLVQGYSPNEVIEACIERQISRLMALLDGKYKSSATQHRPLEFATLCHFFAMDIVGDITYGKEFGFLDEGTDVFGYIKWNDEVFAALVTIATMPWLLKLAHAWPFRLILPKDGDKVGLGRFISLAKKRIEDRFREDSVTGQRDLMGNFISQGVTPKEAFNEAILQIVAGTDSVATVIRMTIFYIICTPHALFRLLDELNAADKAGKLSHPIVKQSEAMALPYLQACIKEGLRIFPAVPALFFKTVPEGGDTISGYHVPAGTRVGHNGYGILRSKKYWGEDAEVFRPERWLEADKERRERMEQIADVQFGFGRYKCLGRHIAVMEVNKVVPTLLRKYDFAVCNPHSPLKMVNAGFFMMSDFWIRATERAVVKEG